MLMGLWEGNRFLRFSTAGKSRFIRQQAVTRQIAALEEEPGVKLLNRTPRQQVRL